MGCCGSRNRGRVHIEDDESTDGDGPTGHVGAGTRRRTSSSASGANAYQCRLNSKLKGATIGARVVLKDNNSVMSGTGSALSTAILMQDRVHFEVEVLKPGPISLGIAGTNIDVDRVLDFQNNCWALLAAESKVSFGDEEKVALDEPLQLAISDILGCIFDQETGQIGFYHNGRPLSFVSPLTARRLRGQLALAVSAAADGDRWDLKKPTFRWWACGDAVAGSAEVEVTFEPEQFSYPLEDRGYPGIMVARSLI